MDNTSRADDPSPFGWIFGGLMAVLGLGALAAGVLRRRGTQTAEDTVVAQDHPRDEP